MDHYAGNTKSEVYIYVLNKRNVHVEVEQKLNFRVIFLIPYFLREERGRERGRKRETERGGERIL